MTTPDITIRRATYTELPEIARCIALAFHDEPLFGQIIHPHRDKYPDDVQLYWLRRFQRKYWDWSQVFLVAVGKDKNGKESIAGVAHWDRQGESSRRFGWGLAKWDPRNLLMPLAVVQTRVLSYLYPDRAADPENEDVIERSYPFLSNVWVGPRAETWYLNFLGVHPTFHGQGIGRNLVAWGMEKAKEEKVSASVIAAYKKDIFYQRCGFVTQVGNACDGDGNPLHGVPGGNIWFRDVDKLQAEGVPA